MVCYDVESEGVTIDSLPPPRLRRPRAVHLSTYLDWCLFISKMLNDR